jgi:gluconolactonase
MLNRFTVLADGLNHPEGLAWDPLTERIYAGGESGEFYGVSTEGAVDVLGTTGGSLLGVAVDGHGWVYGCDSGNGEIVRFEPTTKRISVYSPGVDGRKLDTPNVLAFGPDGIAYVTCSGEDGRPEIVRILPDGVTETWTMSAPGYPNGCLVTADGKELIVVESKAQRLVSIPIGTDGSAGVPRTVAELPDTESDGVALAADGTLWITLYRPDGLARVTPDGEVSVVVDDHLASHFDAPTNIAWVGTSLDRAVVANVGDQFLSIADVGVCGAPLHYPKVPS